MYKVIDINDFDGITVDSTLITVDNTGTQYEFRVPYRFFTENVKFIIYDELNDLEYTIDVVAEDDQGYMKFNYEFTFEDEKSYESKIVDDNGKLIWRGKLYATSQEDLQNYSINKNEREV